MAEFKKTKSTVINSLKLVHFNVETKQDEYYMDLNLSRAFTELHLYITLDINELSYGFVVVQEQINLIHLLDLSGSEYIDIDMQFDDKGTYAPFKRRFLVNKISDIQESGNSKRYIIYFTDVIGMLKTDMRISRPFDNTPVEIIKEVKTIIENPKCENELYKQLMKDSKDNKTTHELFEIYEEDGYTIKDMQTKINFVSGLWNPLHVLEYTASHAVSDYSFNLPENKFADCVIFQNYKGQFVFTSFADMFSNQLKDINNAPVEFKKILGNTEKADENVVNARKTYTIESISFNTNYDIEDLKRSGVLGFKYFIADFYNMDFTTDGEDFTKEKYIELLNKYFSQKTDTNSTVKMIEFKDEDFIKPIKETLNASYYLDVNGTRVEKNGSEVFKNTNPDTFFKDVELPFNMSRYVKKFLSYRYITIRLNDFVSDLDVGKYVTIKLGDTPKGEDIETLKDMIEGYRWIIFRIEHIIDANSENDSTVVTLFTTYSKTNYPKEASEGKK